MTTFKSIAAATLLGALVLGSSFTGKLSGSFKVNTEKNTTIYQIFLCHENNVLINLSAFFFLWELFC